ncbi:MAG: hypothetical protein H0U99_10265 [Chthoniobacterales bacterium]|nr:hypothetical protein [Chthoniobacterales bacterium]
MKVHLKQIPAEGLHFAGEEECPIPGLEAEDVRCVGPLRYDLDLGISEGALWANGSLSQPVELRCVACLEPFTYSIEVHGFTLHTELHGPESVDLTPFFREDILLALPPHPHCDREGGRTCPARAMLDTKTETAEEAKIKAAPDWSALDKLKLKR